MKTVLLSLISAVMLGCGALLPPVSQAQSTQSAHRPPLIIAITVDQMRYDYIERYWDDYCEGGFKRLVNDGFFCRNLKYNYMPTYTGPGHASIFTGTTPSMHGIIENDWYERSTGKTIYCASDSTVSGIGTSGKAGQMSPHYLQSSTLGDELKLFSNMRSKVFGIAMKDRGSILPAGRTADAAYWFISGSEGVWATSSWYMQQLPKWVSDFNQNGLNNTYMNTPWKLLKDATDYDESLGDNNAYEKPFAGKLKPVFPYDLNELKNLNGNYEMIKATPAGNAFTVDFAKALIENESLGKDSFTDMLCVSFSSTDIIGHQFGMHSVEIQDCYLRLDTLLSDFLVYLDKRLGQNNYLLFLTADHGGAPTPSYTVPNHAGGGYWKPDSLNIFLSDKLKQKYGPGEWLLNQSNQNIYLNHSLIQKNKINLKEIQNETATLVSTFPNVLMSFSAANLSQFQGGNPVKEAVENGFSQSMSGDVVFVLKQGFIDYGMMGTTHGSTYSYDTHVPALFFGFGVEPGESFEPHSITDIAPTVASICRLPLPGSATGKCITESMIKRP